MKDKIISYLSILIISIFIIFLIFGDKLSFLDSLFLEGYSDGLKNYFTFIYQSLFGKGIHFQGMNYPYGEHITFTDGQPFLIFINKIFPFVTDINSGIFSINIVLIISILITPYVIYQILIRYNLPVWYSVISAVFIAFNSPQLNRIVSHYALSYAFFIPLIYLFYLNFLDEKKYLTIIYIIFFSTIAGLLHPYYTLIFFIMGGSITLISSFKIYLESKKINLKEAILLSFSFILPFIINFLFIKISNQQNDRIEIPYGSRHYITKFGHIFFPFKGYMGNFWKKILGYEGHTEGDVYIGIIFSITLIYCIIQLSKHLYNNKNLKLYFNSKHYIIFALIPVMFIAMGFHEDILFFIKPQSINKSFAQFRSLARLSWIFYFIITPYLSFVVFNLIQNKLSKKWKYFAFTLVVIFHSNDLYSKIKDIKQTINKYSVQLNYEEIETFDSNKYQAILAIPYFHIGSEKFNLISTESFTKSVRISLKNHLPIMNTMLSRTSISQTYKQLKILSTETKNSVINDLPNQQPLLLIVFKNHKLSSNEKQLIKRGILISESKDWQFYELPIDKITNLKNKVNPLKVVSSINNIYSKNYLNNEVIRLDKIDLSKMKTDSFEVKVEHKFNNKIYSFPQININGEKNIQLAEQDFEMSNNNIVFTFQEKRPQDNLLDIQINGLGIEIVNLKVLEAY